MGTPNNNRRLNVAELDFDAIKTNLKNYLKSQDEFSDYDFDGSALSVLLDVLAYNTHYNGIYTNLAVNEMFLDSASKRSSVVSLAKMLGYTPRSAKCATAVVNLTVTSPTSSPDSVTLPANQAFLTNIDNVTYTFYNVEDVTITPNTSGSYIFSNLKIIEGTPLQYKFVVAAGSRFIIPNANVDISTISVKVQENASTDVYQTYTLSDNIASVTSSSKVFYLKEIDGGLYEIIFGDDNISKALSIGNVVTVDYFISSLEAPNNANVFSYNGVTLLGSNLTVTTVSKATGGAEPEDINSIKFNAPRLYSAQNRAVTPDDYKTIIYNLFPQAKSVTVWGGEDNNPPVYGKTYVCVKPKEADRLTNIEKDSIKNNILASRNIVSIFPEIVDPEYFDVLVTSYVHYNPRETSSTPSQIESTVKAALLDYNETELQRFDSILRFSKMSRIIDECDPSITNNTTRILIRRTFEPIYNISSEYKLNLINPISKAGNKEGDVFSSSGFFIPNSTQVHYLDDDENGNIRLYYLNTNFDKVIVNSTIGTINYDAGLVVVRNLNITSLNDGTLDFIIRPASYDVVSALNQIVEISQADLNITAIADNTNNGDLGAGYNYIFNSIRS
jgi:hypothetical protein